MSVDSLSTVPGVLIQDLADDIGPLILDPSFNLSSSALTGFAKSMILTRSMGKTTKAPTAPAIPPSVKSKTPPATLARALVGVAGSVETTVGSGGDHYPSAPCQPIAKPTLASSSASKSAIPNLCTVSWAPLLAR